MDRAKLSRREILAGLAVTGSSGALVGSGTSALFSDEETFTNNAIEASENVAGVVDLNVDIETSDSGVVFEVSLPEDNSAGNNSDINNNPSHVWVRSKSCPDPLPGVDAELQLECNGDTETIQGPEPIDDLIPNLADGALLSCNSSTDPQDCLRPGETRILKLRLDGEPSSDTNFDLKFFGQQCRYNTGTNVSNPFSGTGPDNCSPPPTNGPSFCQIPCQVDPCSDLSKPLEFDNGKLPPLFGDKGLSFVALCGDNLTDGDVTLNVTARNGDDEPTRVYWSVSDGETVDQVAWKFGSANGNSNGGTFKREFPNGATEGTVYSSTEVGTQVDSGPPVGCPDSADTKLKYEADGQNGNLPALDDKAEDDILPKLKQQLNKIDGIDLTSEIINRDKLTEIRSVRDEDSTGDIDADSFAIVGPTDGEDVIDAGGGNVTAQNYGAIIGTVTNTGGNDVVVKTDGAVAGDIGVEATDKNGNILKGTGNVKIKSGSTVVGDIVTNTDGKNIKVKDGKQDDRSEVLGDALTSGGGSIEVVDYGRVSGTVETDNGGNITVNTKSRVGGDAITSGGGQITVGNSGPSQICGTADSIGSGNGNVDLNGKQQNNVLDELPSEPAKVFGGVRAGGQATLYAGAVSNGIVSDGDVDIDNSKICGSVVCDGNVDVDNFSVITEDEDADDIGIDTDEFNIVTDDGELGSNFENFGASSDDQITNQTISEGSIIAHKTVSGVQNSFVGGDVISQTGDIDIPSSVICGDVIAKGGAIDIDSSKTGPPRPIVEELDGPRSETRRRSLIGGVVRVDGEDCDIAGATVFANGTTEPDVRDDNVAVFVTQRASGGNDATITDDDAGELQSIIKGDVVVNGDLNVDIDNGSRVEGKVKANAGTVSMKNATVEGRDPNSNTEDTVIIGDGGKIDTLSNGTIIEGTVRVKGSGTLDVSGSATIRGDVVQETTNGTVNLGSVKVEGDVKEP